MSVRAADGWETESDVGGWEDWGTVSSHVPDVAASCWLTLVREPERLEFILGEGGKEGRRDEEGRKRNVQQFDYI